MRVAHYLIRGRSGLFYFRLRVPSDLCEAVGVRLIKRATGTRCPRVALAVAVDWAGRYARLFMALRQGEVMAKPPSIREIKKSFERGEASPYTLELPSGFKLTANDEADHQRAMQALEKLGPVAPFMAVAAAPSGAIKPISLVAAKAKWEKAIKNTDPKTIGAKKRAVQDLIDWKQGEIDAAAEKSRGPGSVGPAVRVDEIDTTVCGEWFIHLKAQRKINKKSGKEIEMYSPGTMENKFIYAASFFDWAMANGHYPKGDNPARGHANVAKKVKKARAKSHGAQAFDPEQIGVMFKPDIYARMRGLAARWVPLLLLYTGARSNEIGRLELADIYEWPKGCKAGAGTKVFQFSLFGEDKKLKTEGSARLTPIHPDLINLGFWAYVERMKVAEKAARDQVQAAKQAKVPDEELRALEAAEQEAMKLFPTLTFDAQNGPANAPQTAFRRMLAAAGIKARGTGKVGHHSFRDTVIDKMKQAGVSKEVRHEYTGHENSDSENADAYEQRFIPPALARECHPALDWGIDLKAMRRLLD